MLWMLLLFECVCVQNQPFDEPRVMAASSPRILLTFRWMPFIGKSGVAE